MPDYADCFEFINADMIAKGLSPFLPSKVALRAGKILLDQIADCSRRKVNFAFETTLSGKAYIKLFQKMKQHGYELHMFFLWLPTVKLALARVADRVRKGGHDILEQDVRRRFARGLKNLFGAYCSLFDTWSVFDNSTGEPKLVFSAEHGAMSIKDQLKYSKIIKQAGYKNGL